MRAYTSQPRPRGRRRASYAAGVLIFALINSVVHVLLGADPTTGAWSDFGGRSEPCDDERPECTAMRELDEETLCTLDPTGLRVCAEPVVSRTLRDHAYYVYVALLRDASECAAVVASYADRLRVRTRHVEKARLEWFPWPLRTAADAPPLRDVFLRTIELRGSEIYERLESLIAAECAETIAPPGSDAPAP